MTTPTCLEAPHIGASGYLGRPNEGHRPPAEQRPHTLPLHPAILKGNVSILLTGGYVWRITYRPVYSADKTNQFGTVTLLK